MAPPPWPALVLVPSKPASVQWASGDAHTRPLRVEGTGSAPRHRRGGVHVLPLHRPDLPAHQPRDHEERAVSSRVLPPGLHAAAVPDADAADGVLVAVLLVGGRLAGDLEVT